MKERLLKQIMTRKTGIAIIEDRFANQLIGKHEITILWRQLLWEFANGTHLNKNMLVSMECFDVIKIDIRDCCVIAAEDQRLIRRIIGQLAKRSHVILLIHEEFSKAINHGAEIPLLNMLSADTVREEQ